LKEVREMRRVALAVVIGIVVSTAAVALASSGAGPLTAGSPRHPQGLKLQMTFGWQGLPAGQQPILQGIDIWFPRGSIYNGSRYPICSLRTLDAQGPQGCPKGSIMGTGTGTAYADTTITRPQMTVVNGGGSVVYFYTVLNNPARVQEPIVGHITRLNGEFDYHLSATIPQNLQVVAGVPIELTYLNITAGRGTWLETTGVPAGIKIQSSYNTGATTWYQVWVQDE
jgi:hypothetical protein